VASSISTRFTWTPGRLECCLLSSPPGRALLARSPSTEVTIGIPTVARSKASSRSWTSVAASSLKSSTPGSVLSSKHSQDFDPASVGALREAPKPLCHVQPDGPSWVRDGNLVRWQNWSFRFTLHPREGLVLHTVSWDDHGRARPVLYRASLSEMVVPYGDPDGNWVWRNAFDEGEYGLGRLATPLEPSKDAPDPAT
jgi:hypothetical protein